MLRTPQFTPPVQTLSKMPNSSMQLLPPHLCFNIHTPSPRPRQFHQLSSTCSLPMVLVKTVESSGSFLSLTTHKCLLGNPAVSKSTSRRWPRLPVASTPTAVSQTSMSHLDHTRQPDDLSKLRHSLSLRTRCLPWLLSSLQVKPKSSPLPMRPCHQYLFCPSLTLSPTSLPLAHAPPAKTILFLC